MFFKKFENDDRGFVQREYDIRDDEIKPSNSKKNMYCTKCKTIQRYGVKCKKCGNWLVEI